MQHTCNDSSGGECAQKKIKNALVMKSHNKYLWNTSLCFNNMGMFLYWIFVYV